MSVQPTESASQQPEVMPLPRSRAFVMRLSTDTDVGQARIAGRIEHVMSGQATRFGSLEELLSFLNQVLDHAAEKPP